MYNVADITFFDVSYFFAYTLLYMTKYLLFDWDDTLWDFSANSALALDECYNTMGLDRFFVGALDFRTQYYKANNALWAMYRMGKIDRQYLVSHRFMDTLMAAGCHDASLSSRLNDTYLAIVETKSLLVPNAREVLEYLTEKGYELIVVTNGFIEPQQRKLRNSGLRHFLSHVVISADAGANKPSRAFFDYVFAHTGALPAQSMLIGDDADSDISGAVEYGLRCVYFNRKGIPCPYPANHEITDLIQLKEIL